MGEYWVSPDSQITLLHGDCREVMAALEADSVDAIVTDPPYGLEFMGKEWDKLTRPKAGHLGGFADGNKPSFERVRGRLPAMQEWHCAWAIAGLRVLRPGGHLVAFGGTRTHHRLWCALEDAGFEIRDTLCWLYGSGFPKSKNLDGEWDGWGTALKPAWEPIVLARKPLSEPTVAANVLRWGTGGLNIDGCRIEGPDGDGHWSGDDGSDATSRPGYDGGFTRGGHKALGRWPANVALDEEAAAILDAQSGETGGYAPASGPTLTGPSESLARGRFGGVKETPFHRDSGGASRFFYCGKASRAERKGSKHPTVKPLALTKWLVALVTPPSGLVLDPFSGSGTTLEAAYSLGFRVVGIDTEAEYLEDAKRRLHQAALLLG
jgi:site-specific DNA-methyltransferase (adenine-specific)